MMYTVGIDIGSAFSKGVLFGKGSVRATFVKPSGGDYQRTAQNVWSAVTEAAGLEEGDVVCTIATGYGSQMVDCANGVRTDLVCHARGIAFFCPLVRTAVDVGDFSSKAFRIDSKGRLTKFLLSGKCAGGSGRILRVIAKVLHLDIEKLGALSLNAGKRVDFHTSCAVFAESEAVSRIAEGVSKEDLLAGIHRALAAQIQGLAERLEIENDFALVGGGAQDIGLVAAMQEIIGHSVSVPPNPQLTAALGAALIAQELATESCFAR